MPHIIILVGLPGSGKSSVLQEAMKSAPPFTVVNFGDWMLEEAASKKIDRDALRKLPISEQQKIGNSVAKKIATHSHGTVIVDTHALIKTPYGFCPGIPESLLRLLEPKVMVFVEVPAQAILERRQQDKTRHRDLETIEQIEYVQQITRSYLVTCSLLTGAVFAPISNAGSIEEAAKQLIASIPPMSQG